MLGTSALPAAGCTERAVIALDHVAGRITEVAYTVEVGAGVRLRVVD